MKNMIFNVCVHLDFNFKNKQTIGKDGKLHSCKLFFAFAQSSHSPNAKLGRIFQIQNG